ncbi:MAG: SDR family NAD(P)-dependent oxidoreductase [Oscillospiraceae bacterium]|nr:SDR family NAD(P)-dependent oxidoreductase [Oscillospiraceae bacterium]
MQIAIITGASSGLGREFVKQISQKEPMEEIWVIARRTDRLFHLAKQLSVPIVPIPLDLTKQESFTRFHALLEEKKPDIRILINAAGFGKMGSYKDISLQDSGDMVELNCRALMQVTLLSLPYMSRGARILEICSTASFQPLPGLNVYAASKAFVQSYSRSLRWELFGHGVHVTAVCPYWITDTEFIPVSQENGNPAAIRHFPFSSHARHVVRAALRDSKLNLPVSAPGPVSFLQRFFAKFIPHELIIGCWEGLRRL